MHLALHVVLQVCLLWTLLPYTPAVPDASRSTAEHGLTHADKALPSQMPHEVSVLLASVVRTVVCVRVFGLHADNSSTCFVMERFL